MARCDCKMCVCFPRSSGYLLCSWPKKKMKTIRIFGTTKPIELIKIPEWLQFALADAEWVKVQRAAWERYLSPETFGRPAPQFLEISVRNLKRFPYLLSKRCRLVVEHHRGADQEFVKEAEAYLRQLRSAGNRQPIKLCSLPARKQRQLN